VRLIGKKQKIGIFLTAVNRKGGLMYKLSEKIDQTVKQFLMDSSTVEIGELGLKELGLDFRCGKILISVEERFVAVCNPRNIDYYGGWEYIDAELKLDAGDYCFYDGEARRVDRVIRFYKELKAEGYRYVSNEGFVKKQSQQSTKQPVDVI